MRRRKKQVPKFSRNRKNELLDWISQWKELKKLGFSLKHKHFFLEGRHLDDISQELISNAKTEVLVANPYIDNCSLSNTLLEASKGGIEVRLVTRPPEDVKEQYKRKKQDYHTKLKEEGIDLLYDNRVHAKLTAIDRAVAVISSMNFYSKSAGGGSWEAGVVSIENVAVESVVDSILRLLENL